MGRKEEKKKNKNNNSESSNGGGRGKVISDSRFSSVHSDPRFQEPRKHQSKVEIDSRFSRVFSGKNFNSSNTRLDKRGKLKNPNAQNHLKHYYQPEQEKEAEEQPLKKEKKKKKKKKSQVVEESEEEEEEVGSGEEEEEEEENESLDESDETSDSNSDTTDDDEDEVRYEEEGPEEPEEKVPIIEQETSRLAIVNMDWSHVRAVDLYVLLSSFLPKGGQILSVSVYPSEFGLERMEEEATKGPVGLFQDEGKSDDEDEEDEIDDEKLRAYEKSRLRYYYAVVECDSSATADYIYKSCDGTEFERTSNVLDLRFIPDSMEFKHPPRDVAKEVPTNYEALDFHTQALQHSKIHLSWEEDEPQRSKMLKRTFNPDQLDELEFKEYIASDDEDSDDDDENDEAVEDKSKKKLDKREKFRALLQAGDASEGDASEGDKDMEVTFVTGLENISKSILEKKKDENSETVWEAYLRKKSEKKKARKNRSKNLSDDENSDSDLEAHEQPDDFFVEEPSVKSSKVGKSSRRGDREQEADKGQEASRAELELLLADDEGTDNHPKGYNLKHKKAKGKKGKEVPVEDKLPTVDYDDPRFAAVFNSSLYALDPTDPQYKRSAAYNRQLAQKQNAGVREETTNGEKLKLPMQASLTDNSITKRDDRLQSDNGASKKENFELSSLVRSVKRKAQQIQVPSKNNPSNKGRLLEPDSRSRMKEQVQVPSTDREAKKDAPLKKKKRKS